MNKAIVEAFNKFAEQYADFTFTNNILQYELNRFISLIPKNGKVLDLGCGSGRDVQYFLDYDLNPVGVDASENLIEEAKKRVEIGEFKVMDIVNLDFKEEFDGVWAQDIISYIGRNEINGVFSRINLSLVKKGMFFLSVREGDGEKLTKHEKLGKEEIMTGFFDKEELEKLLKNNGFEIMNSYKQQGEDFTWINIFAKKS
jgi:predicted TPR repeat methyltransferase